MALFTCLLVHSSPRAGLLLEVALHPGTLRRRWCRHVTTLASLTPTRSALADAQRIEAEISAQSSAAGLLPPRPPAATPALQPPETGGDSLEPPPSAVAPLPLHVPRGLLEAPSLELPGLAELRGGDESGNPSQPPSSSRTVVPRTDRVQRSAVRVAEEHPDACRLDEPTLLC